MLSFLFACYVDKKKLKEAGINYLKGNTDLGMDVLAIIMDHTRILLEYQLAYYLLLLSQEKAYIRAGQN